MQQQLLGGTGDIPGVQIRRLQPWEDERGRLTEVFRNEWHPTLLPVQWNHVRSRPRVLRGVHVHVRHTDHLLVLGGTMLLGLVDLREGTEHFRRSTVLELSGTEPTMVSIETGVAHGFYFPEPADILYSVTHYWDPVTDELGCRWDDAGLGLDWPVSDPILSPRDQNAKSLNALLEELRDTKDKPW
ncbi:dTDP-4-dehydrorhamnose 3,5-epimerase family protein [Acidovorax sp. Root275]|jgi:dTDP-4-dehydrorhamnose 3,5-epimerase|uniref:dTDP-4-dehydrorhamnose 3,5-epimerase family protein n=1 Tax=Acidovorax sp. Root275 TaxID=1736508 RepID=UPI001F5269B1|nr:dTDP-4-dehydrorhamnose 3,5-epimerase family protein [Acidovorax sp. Root275]